MTCDTITHIDEDGRKHFKKKEVYNRLDDAIKMAKKMNALPKQIMKLVGYKCEYCHKYHIGRSKKEITEKERVKFLMDTVVNAKFKVVGKIDLSKFEDLHHSGRPKRSKDQPKLNIANNR